MRDRYSSSNSSLESQALCPVIIPALVELQALLPSKIPSVAQESQDAVLVHGDFKIDNLIYGSSGALLSLALHF
jgi:aminoglycoside phosphotransferase (APT) family kinase protein